MLALKSSQKELLFSIQTNIHPWSYHEMCAQTISKATEGSKAMGIECAMMILEVVYNVSSLYIPCYKRDTLEMPLLYIVIIMVTYSPLLKPTH